MMRYGRPRAYVSWKRHPRLHEHRFEHPVSKKLPSCQLPSDPESTGPPVQPPPWIRGFPHVPSSLSTKCQFSTSVETYVENERSCGKITVMFHMQRGKQDSFVENTGKNGKQVGLTASLLKNNNQKR